MQSIDRDNDSNSSKVASPPVVQKNDNSSLHNPETDDLDDSPLVIDEETTDSVETKRTPPAAGEAVPKVLFRSVFDPSYRCKNCSIKIAYKLT